LSLRVSTALRDLGYVEGQKLALAVRFAQGKPERLPGLARELVQLRVDVIFAIGTLSVRAARDATTTIPIVMFNQLDPVAAGFARSLARPGGNITGVLIAAEGTLAGKRLGLLKERCRGPPGSLSCRPTIRASGFRWKRRGRRRPPSASS
jgi:putative ABC transport system substrate-binding protein